MRKINQYFIYLFVVRFRYRTGINEFNVIFFFRFYFQEDHNRGKPNWEHLSDELHVLLTVEDTENRAQMKLERAVEEVKKLLVPVSGDLIKIIFGSVFISSP